ncbi:MAG: electron transport complex subunit RsxE [Wujia sp.]
MNKLTERLKNGIITENPTFVQMLGMCPTLAVTTSAINGAGMGLATTVILTLSNLMISLLRKVIPDKVRIPAFIVIIASFVTIVQFVMQAFIPSLYDSLGLFIPLIVVNCIILGRAEAYASKNQVLPSVFDGIGMGLGFTVGLTTIGIVREFFGSGSFFGIDLIGKLNSLVESNAGDKLVKVLADQGLFEPISIFVFAPGAFFVLAFLIAIINRRNIKKAKKKGEKPELCNIADCASCQNTACHGREE